MTSVNSVGSAPYLYQDASNQNAPSSSPGTPNQNDPIPNNPGPSPATPGNSTPGNSTPSNSTPGNSNPGNSDSGLLTIHSETHPTNPDSGIGASLMAVRSGGSQQAPTTPTDYLKNPTVNPDLGSGETAPGQETGNFGGEASNAGSGTITLDSPNPGAYGAFVIY